MQLNKKKLNKSSGGAKFEIKHKSRCHQKSKFFNWGPSMSIGGPGPTCTPFSAGPGDGGSYSKVGGSKANTRFPSPTTHI